jgi:M6 family metalloprotease-like protein
MSRKSIRVIRRRRPARSQVHVELPKEGLFVGSYHRVWVKHTSNINWEDLKFIIPDGPKAGLVSPSNDSSYQERQHFILLAGYEPGIYKIEVRHAITNVLLFLGNFEVTDLWKNYKEGPSFWFTGIVGSYASGAAWGGGPSGPQNVNVLPATGTRRIAVLLVDTNSQRYTSNSTTLQQFRDRWDNELINGVIQNGVTRSVRQYYREVSYSNFDISAQVFGPVQLPGSWTDYFTMDSGGSWAPQGSYWQACVTAGDSLINYTNFDTLVCVSQQVDGPPVQRAWPYANGGTFTSAEGNVSLGVISMPNEWGTDSDREIYDTFSHELGHNLGLADQYTPSVPGRNLGSWEIMAWDDPLPHFTIAHKMMLGWVPSSWIQTFNFSAMGGMIDQNVTLHPIEQGAPPGGRKSGIEIRIADGWNYYFEYRRQQTPQIGDRSLPEDSIVLPIDVVSSPYTPPFSRPPLLHLPPGPAGVALANTESYQETDFSDPTYPTDFRVDVSGIDGLKADVRIRYGVLSKPDPSIRPWPAGPDRQWQSPDIEIRNTRNQADPSWFNVPWVGNANTIVARIKNNGTMTAPQVRANFSIKNYNVGGAPESFLDFAKKDIAPGATEEFICPTPWVPPTAGHYCVIVRIPLYQTPATPPAVPVVEMTELNNVAQSNYDRFISSSSSAPTREVTYLDVGNPYPMATRVFLWPGQTNPLYRTYLEHTWLWLNPGETRKVMMMFEYAPDNLKNKVYPPHLVKEYTQKQRLPNDVAVASQIEDPNDIPRHKVDILGGVQTQVVTGKGTRFEKFGADGNRVYGKVVTVSDAKPVSGQVIVRVHIKDEVNPYVYRTVNLIQGSFATSIDINGIKVDAYYLPVDNYADCWSKEVITSKSKTKSQ